MAKIAKCLTAIEVGRITTPGYHAIGTVAGLYLQCRNEKARSWVLRIKVAGKRRDIGLGAYPEITLAKAHEKARQTRELVREGVDPVLRKKTLTSALHAAQARAVTFADASDTYIKAMESEWKNVKSESQWRSSLAAYAYPVIGKMVVSDIGLPHVLKILEPIWKTKTVTALRVRGRIESVLNWAKTKGYCSGENPARWRGHLENLLAAPNKIKGEEHHPAIQIDEVGAFMLDLRTHQGIGARALEFTMLTASRSGEVRGATWSEIDISNKLWTIPAGRMKAGKEHREPLSDDAVALLKALPRFAETEVVFASRQGGTLSDMTLSQLMRRMNYKDKGGRVCVPHGLRSTFRDWAAERTSYPREVVEAAMAHTNADKTEAAYLRSDLFQKRARLMAEWSAFLNMVHVEADNVVGIRSAA